MNEHFIENIKIENFKCFEDLEINGFKRVNLFGGKNNVGKTALLEAIELFTASPDTISLIKNLFKLFKRRRSNLQSPFEWPILRESFNIFKINSSQKYIKVNVGVSLPLNNTVDDVNLVKTENENEILSYDDTGVKFIVNRKSRTISIGRLKDRVWPFLTKRQEDFNVNPHFGRDLDELNGSIE